tara:strand:- start:3877 stop:6831 length:2955 start_codon:yes stop_codon:yes gene_type:complete
MSVKKFNFVSPGVFLEEIDNSQLPGVAPPVGPCVIGRTEKGPAMRPVTVNSFSEFIEMFGNPIAGGRSGDVWRDGNYSAPTYAGFAAQAWLKNSAPITVVRLLGEQHSQATATGKAGFDVGNVASNVAGGAYGLFVFDTEHTGNASDDTRGHHPATASLAAVFYVPTSMDSTVALTGSPGVVFPAQYHDAAADTYAAGTNLSGGVGILISASSGDYYVKISSSLIANETVRFNFDTNSDRYIRKVFNTNPTLTNTAISATGSRKGYWLGETFDRFIGGADVAGGMPMTGGYDSAMILGLRGNDSKDWGDREFGAKNPQTGWFFSQDMGSYGTFEASSAQKLFRLVGRDSGEWLQNNIKVSITNIKGSSNKSNLFGSFSVELRKMQDNDKAPHVIEKFSNCNLNPNSVNYIARKIGDAFSIWNESERRYKYHGRYGNSSRYIRVEMHPDVDKGGIDPGLVPFGFHGPPKVVDLLHVTGNSVVGSGNNLASSYFLTGGMNSRVGGNGRSRIFFTASTDQFKHDHVSAEASDGGPNAMTASFHFPKLALRWSGVAGNVVPKRAYWGVDTNESGSTRFDPSVRDIIRVLPAGMEEGSSGTETSLYFTLDNLKATSDVHTVNYVSGSRLDGTSITAANANGFSVLLDDKRYNKFTTLFHGGFDGLDVTEKEPFRNTLLSDQTETTSYEFNSIKRSIDSISNPEVVEMNLASIPGLTNAALTEHLINTCELRADSLAIIDLREDYIPSHENTADDSSNVGTVSGAVAGLKSRGINSSYGCAYYPWVLGRDTLSDSVLWLPPSVAALGTMANSEAAEALWFAPAGFTRGGLTQGAAGIPIVGTRQQLTQGERDRLYDANINPIATFPNEGVVVFGQKTLQVTPSALDRINVRRLLIFIKKEMSRIAATTLFEPNAEATWERFSDRAEGLLRDIKGSFGLDDFKVVLDETTTTPELVDRNIMYAKVFLKPTRAIEFIALDFIVTDSGASFAD